MQRISIAPDDQLEAASDVFAMAEAMLGFVPNAIKILARQPAMMRSFMGLAGAVLGPGNPLSPELIQMIANVTSQASGCRYCQAHTAHGAEKKGVSAAKIRALWEYESNSLFSPEERAALTLAQAAGSVPNQATDAHFEALKPHFTEDEIVAIVSVIALFGFLNRWNDTMATTLEDGPLDFANANLGAMGWEVGNHG